MLEHQIVAGFSEIKTQLRTQASLSKSLDELQLWFSFEEEVLYVHDFHDHKKSMALAVYNKPMSTWQVIFRGNAYGKEVIEYVIGKSDRDNLAKSFKELYESYGYIRF